MYSLEDLPLELRDRIAKEEQDLAEVVLVFLVEPRKTELLEGEKMLELAVRAAVRDGSLDKPEPQRPPPPGFLPPTPPP